MTTDAPPAPASSVPPGSPPSSSPTPTPNPAPTNNAPDWRASIPEEFKNDTTLAGVKDLPDLIKQHVNAQRMIGKNRIALPGKDAKPEEIKEFHKALGVPDDPKGYDLSKIKKPDNLSGVDENAVGAFKETALKLGLNPGQVEGLYDWFLKNSSERVGADMTNLKAQRDEGINGLKKEWGNNFDSNAAVARLAVQKFGGQELVDYLNKTGLGNDAIFVKLFHSIGQRMSEGNGLLASAPGAGGFAGSRDEAKAAIAAIRAGTPGPYQNFWKDMNAAKDPAVRAKLNSEWLELNRRASEEATS